MATKQKKAAPAADRRQKVQSAEIGMSVLKALAAMGGAASLTALSNRLQENPAKVHRYLASLVGSGFVLQEPGASRYVLGPEAIAIGLAAMRQADALNYSTMELRALAESLDVSCFVAVMGNQGPTIVRWEEPAQPVVVNVRVGSVLPILWSATGRAFGAFAKSEQLEALVHLELQSASGEQRKLLPNRKAVDAMFDSFRAAGCAWVRDVLLRGVSAVAAPVFDANGRVAAVITALGVSGSFDPDPKKETAAAVRQCAQTVSARLGFRPRETA